MDTIIITDSCSDLPIEFVEKNNIPVINMIYQFLMVINMLIYHLAKRMIS
jgi:hypothetical protein